MCLNLSKNKKKNETISLHPFIHYYLSVIRQEDIHSLAYLDTRPISGSRARQKIEATQQKGEEKESGTHLEIITDD